MRHEWTSKGEGATRAEGRELNKRWRQFPLLRILPPPRDPVCSCIKEHKTSALWADGPYASDLKEVKTGHKALANSVNGVPCSCVGCTQAKWMSTPPIPSCSPEPVLTALSHSEKESLFRKGNTSTQERLIGHLPSLPPEQTSLRRTFGRWRLLHQSVARCPAWLLSSVLQENCWVPVPIFS